MTGKLKKWVLTPGDRPEDGYQELNHGVRAFEEPGRHRGSRWLSPQPTGAVWVNPKDVVSPASRGVKHGRSGFVSRPVSRSDQ